MRASLIALFVGYAAGCSEAHGLDAGLDGGHQADGAPCTILGHVRCDGTCGQTDLSCPPMTRCGGHICIGLPEVSVPCDWVPYMADPGSPPYLRTTYCEDGRTCVHIDALQTGGVCIDDALCVAQRAAGIPIDCSWSDGTPVSTGAPSERVCPPAPYPATPFCGGPCTASCGGQVESGWGRGGGVGNALWLSCIGRSDSRGLGICAVIVRSQIDESPCRRGVRDGVDICTGHDAMPPDIPVPIPGMTDTTCVCLVFRDASRPDGLADLGYATSTEGCRAYRARYPDAIQCVVDRAWHTLP